MEKPQSEENGQVLKTTEFGKLLFLVASLPQYKTFLEVGTWKGDGSTRCIVDGLLERLKEKKDDVHFWSLEANHKFYQHATRFWEAACLPFLHLVYGKLHEDCFMSAEEVEKDPMFGWIKTHYEIWYKHEAIDYKNAPLFKLDYLPATIDVIILDGGEFCGYADWEALRGKEPKIVFLDDTNAMKNRRVYDELKANSMWKIWVESNDRNGFAVFIRSPS